MLRSTFPFLVYLKANFTANTIELLYLVLSFIQLQQIMAL